MLNLKLPYFGHLMQRTDSFKKTLMLGKIEGRRRKGMTEMVGWHHQLDGHVSGSSPGGSREFEAGTASARIRKQLLN